MSLWILGHGVKTWTNTCVLGLGVKTFSIILSVTQRDNQFITIYLCCLKAHCLITYFMLRWVWRCNNVMWIATLPPRRGFRSVEVHTSYVDPRACSFPYICHKWSSGLSPRKGKLFVYHRGALTLKMRVICDEDCAKFVNNNDQVLYGMCFIKCKNLIKQCWRNFV